MNDSNKNNEPTDQEPAVETPQPSHNSEASTNKEENPDFRWSHAFVIVGTLAVLVFTFAYYVIQSKQSSYSPAGDIGESELQRDLPAFLKANTSRNTYVAVSVRERDETLLLTPEQGGWMLAGQLTEQKKVSVQYQFGFPSQKKWHIELNGNVCIITAPELEFIDFKILKSEVLSPANKNLVPTDTAFKVSNALKAQFINQGQQILDDTNINIAARQRLEALFYDWLVSLGAFSDNRFAAVKIDFTPIAMEQAPPIKELTAADAITDVSPENTIKESSAAVQESTPPVTP